MPDKPDADRSVVRRPFRAEAVAICTERTTTPCPGHAGEQRHMCTAQPRASGNFSPPNDVLIRTLLRTPRGLRWWGYRSCRERLTRLHGGPSDAARILSPTFAISSPPRSVLYIDARIKLRQRASTDAVTWAGQENKPRIMAVIDRRQRHLHDPCPRAEVRRSPSWQARLQAASLAIEQIDSPSSAESGVLGAGLHALGLPAGREGNLTSGQV